MQGIDRKLSIERLLEILEVGSKRIFTWLPVAEEKLEDADKDDTVEGGDLFDQHRCYFSSWNQAEWQPDCLDKLEENQVSGQLV